MPKSVRAQIVIPQRFPKEVTVVVWGNKGGVMGVEQFGHAALLVRTKREQDMYKVFEADHVIGLRVGRISTFHQKTYRYFSFWPSDGAGKLDARLRQGGDFQTSYLTDMVSEISSDTQRSLQNGKFTPNAEQKIIFCNEHGYKIFGKEADKTTGIRILETGRFPRLGLNVWLMCKDANNFVNSDHFAYVLASKTRNCSGVAARFLKAGGAEAFYSIPSVGYTPVHPFYMTPNNVHSMALATARGVTQINEILDYFYRSSLQNFQKITSKAKFQRDCTFEIYSKKSWIKRSAVFGKSRGLTLKMIDTNIGRYHDYKWDDNYSKKLKALCHIIYHVNQHRMLSRSGKRDDAIHMLTQQILAVVLSQVMYYKTEEPWPPAIYLGHNDRKTLGSKKG